MGAARLPGPPDVRQQPCVRLGHLEVVGLNRDGPQNGRDEALAFLPPGPFRDLDPDPQLGHRDRRNRDIVLVCDQVGKRVAAALGID